MIILYGPAWPTVEALRTALREVPEVSEFRLGGRPTGAIEQLTKFREAGLLTPDFTVSLAAAMEWVRDGAIVFGRRLIHTRGNDIVLPGRLTRRAGMPYSRRWMESEWWSRYIPPTEEWRVHVFDGKSIARGKKVHTGNSWRKAPVRNIGNGWTFDFSVEAPKGLRKAAKAACHALGYPHGAVDILQVDPNVPAGQEPARIEFYVLEVNRVPALTCPYTRTAWVEAIRRHVRESLR